MKQSDSHNQRERSDADSEPPLIVKADANKKKDASGRHANDPDHKKSYRRSWRGASPLTKLQLGLTAVVAIATVIYALFSGWQLYVIRAGGEDTRKLADAAQRQASASGQQVNAMQGQLDTMRDQANSARAQTNTLNESLAETQKAVKAAEKQAGASLSQAKTSQLSADAAQKSASIAERAFTIGERPYIAVREIKLIDFEEGKQPTVEIYFINKGKTPALNTRFRSYIGGRNLRRLGEANYPPPEILSQGNVESEVSVKQLLNVLTKVAQTQRDSDIRAVKDGKIWLFVWGIVEYADGAGVQHVLKFCQFYDPATRQLTFCDEHNTSS
jgi:multidrug efflux pump subunit AcrA (membrane-fusion protein)